MSQSSNDFHHTKAIGPNLAPFGLVTYKAHSSADIHTGICKRTNTEIYNRSTSTTNSCSFLSSRFTFLSHIEVLRQERDAKTTFIILRSHRHMNPLHAIQTHQQRESFQVELPTEPFRGLHDNQQIHTKLLNNFCLL